MSTAIPAAPPSAGAPAATNRPMTREERRVIFASSLGTVFEWYDFYLYGSLAAIIAAHFFSGVNPTAGFIFALMAFAAGFAVRPFGALVFGRLGDLVGRKYTFLITILIMGLSTFLVGVLPSYSSIGIAAPIILIILRLLQGLALGGEYGGAATYVAEHAPQNRRGFYTSWIQTTATMGLFLSLLIILGVRTSLGEETFLAWGWRIPFLISVVLLGISVWIRMRLNESPAFRKMKEEGTGSKAPVTIIADPATCSFQFNPVGTSSFTSSCDILKAFMASNSVNYSNQAAPAGTPAVAKIGADEFPAFEGSELSKADMAAKSAELNAALTEAIRSHGYPAKADPSQINYVMVVLLLTFLVILVTMVYGPIAAMLVEMFPTRIRYTSMSLPYHIGNGWFGGFLPPVAFAMVAATGNIYDGLWYPIAIAVMTLVIGVFFVRETKDNDINS